MILINFVTGLYRKLCELFKSDYDLSN